MIRFYKGYYIEQDFPSGMYSTRGNSGYLRADTINGLKGMIRKDISTFPNKVQSVVTLT